MYGADGRSCLHPETIAANLRLIREDAWSADTETLARSCVGVLTTENRTLWYDPHIVPILCPYCATLCARLRVRKHVFLLYVL